MDLCIDELVASMTRYIGHTVTVFTTSGGLSGAGFTGVLMFADPMVLKILTDVGAAPACPIGSSCTNVSTPCGMPGGFGYAGNNWLGAEVTIPMRSVAAFTHNAI